jgi:carotenoid cleavage dioxygenase-like enzyme
MNKTELVAAILTRHTKRRDVRGLECSCGYLFHLGQPVSSHRADLIVNVLELDAAGLASGYQDEFTIVHMVEAAARLNDPKRYPA